MESDEEILNNIEEKLYSQLYHDSNDIQPQSNNHLPPSDLFNNQSSSLPRYYQDTKNKSKPKLKLKYNNKERKLQNTLKKNDENANTESVNSANAQKIFVPYSSVLQQSHIITAAVSLNETDRNQITKQIPILKKDQKIIEDKILNNKPPSSYLDDINFTSPCKKQMKITFEKKTKAKSKETSKNKQMKKPDSRVTELIEIVSSDDDNSVIYVETPAPPLIALESSSDDDDDGVKKRNKVNRKGGGSPSTSSMISDDFIVTSDKCRLRNAVFPSSKNATLNNIANSSRDDDNTSNDSIYNSKVTKFSDNLASSSKKVRQRSSSNESNKVLDDDDDISNDRNSFLKMQEKRLRFETSNYNENEFSTLISSAIVRDSTSNKVAKNFKPIKAKTTSKVIEILDEDDDGLMLNKEVIQKGGKNSKESASEKKNSKSNRRRSNSKVDDEMQSNECDLILNVRSHNNNSKETIEIDLSKESSSTSLTTPNEMTQGQNKLDCEIGWNSEMKYFYNEYSFGRNFSVVNVKSYMPCDDWKVSNADKYKAPLDNDRKIRCRNCNELGHKQFNCYRPKKKIICFMCGEYGHHATKCPNGICLRCGKNNTIYSTMCGNCAKFVKKRCPLCKTLYHDLDQCPDKWRRYHSTTEDTATLDISCTRNDRMFCSLCAKSGHFAENCSYFQKYNGYITSSWFAVSNKAVYSTNCNFTSKKNEQLLQLITYMENYSFNLKLPSNCQFYPRFKNHFLSQFGSNAIEQSHEEEDMKNERNDDDANSDIENNSNELEDFIPMPKEVRNEEKMNMAKILLTNDHLKIIESHSGQDKLAILCAKFNIEIKFQLKATGKFMYINGSHSNQSSFYQELRQFFYKSQLNKCEKIFSTSTRLPKNISKVAVQLKTNLESIKSLGVRESKRVLNKLMQSELNFDHKMVLKHRKSLNILFIGSAQLKEGSSHLKELRKILHMLEKEIEAGNGNSMIEQSMKDKLEAHIKYIFSPMDHGNYFELYNNYKKVLQKSS